MRQRWGEPVTSSLSPIHGSGLGCAHDSHARRLPGRGQSLPCGSSRAGTLRSRPAGRADGSARPAAQPEGLGTAVRGRPEPADRHVPEGTSTAVRRLLPQCRGTPPGDALGQRHGPARAGRAGVDIAAALRADPDVARVSIDDRRYRDVEPDERACWDELWAWITPGRICPRTPGTAGRPTSNRWPAGARRRPGPPHGRRDHRRRRRFQPPDLGREPGRTPGESGAGKETNGVDDDANGYIDNVHGWDFCHNDNTVHDFGDDFHGTHVAGTIAASLEGPGSSASRRGLDHGPQVPRQRSWCGFDCGRSRRSPTPVFGVRIANASWGGDGRPEDAPELYRRSRPRGCCSWPRPATAAMTTTMGRHLAAGLVRPAQHRVGGGDRQTGALATFSTTVRPRSTRRAGRRRS